MLVSAACEIRTTFQWTRSVFSRRTGTLKKLQTKKLLNEQNNDSSVPTASQRSFESFVPSHVMKAYEVFLRNNNIISQYHPKIRSLAVVVYSNRKEDRIILANVVATVIEYNKQSYHYHRLHHHFPQAYPISTTAVRAVDGKLGN